MDTRIILLLAIILMNPVSAKFICGQVEPTETLIPSWYEVEASLEKNKTISTTCQVSPSDLKYCCDIASLKEIYNYTWRPNDIFETKITDPNSGHFAPPQKLLLTSQDYDISPKLILKKAIKTFQKIQKIYTSPIQIHLIPSEECDASRSVFTSSPGKNQLFYQVTCNSASFDLQETFYVLENISLKKSPSKTFSKETKTFHINLDTNTDLPQTKLKEYIPSEFKIISASSNATIQKSTSDYNVIIWQFQGRTFEGSYVLESPEISILPKSYKTITKLEDQIISNSSIKVQKILPFPTTFSNSKTYEYTPETFSKVSQNNPIISTSNNTTAALYSKSPKELESFNLKKILNKITLDKNYIHLSSYEVQSTLPTSEQNQIKIIHETTSNFLEKNNYKKIVFYGKNKEESFELNSTKKIQAEKTRYEINSKPIEELHIFAQKNSLSILDKILNILEILKFW